MNRIHELIKALLKRRQSTRVVIELTSAKELRNLQELHGQPGIAAMARDELEIRRNFVRELAVTIHVRHE